MIDLVSITNKNNKQHSKKWPYIPDHPYRILIIGRSGSGRKKVLLHLIKGQDDSDKMYLYAKYLSKPKYEFLIKTREYEGKNYFKDPNAFIECSNIMNYENITRILMTITQTGKERF